MGGHYVRKTSAILMAKTMASFYDHIRSRLERMFNYIHRKFMCVQLCFRCRGRIFRLARERCQTDSIQRNEKDIYNYEETTHIYFANREYLGYFRSDLERDEVKLSQVSPYFIQAVIATEDEHFYEHKGVVPKAIIRAIFQEATNSSTRSGGSTLTQQLVKNQILTSEVSFERKAKEVLLALRLEKFLRKMKF